MAKVGFMARHSASWRVAIRLRAYRQYVAPILEYGAPLVVAWAITQSMRWMAANMGWRELVQWIANGAWGWRMSQNLLGLQPLEYRFEVLRMTFIYVRSTACAFRQPALPDAVQAATEQGVQAIVAGQQIVDELEAKYIDRAGGQGCNEAFPAQALGVETGCAGKAYPLDSDHTMGLETKEAWSTIGWSSASTAAYAERFLPVSPWGLVLQVHPQMRFRGATIPARRRRVSVPKSGNELVLAGETRLTNVDFLLNEGQWARAYGMLQRVRANLTAVWEEEMAEPDMDEDDLTVTL
ncbi:hypothetical protein LTR56_024136 [Elasticomyces elasticus]|nr:hypothetical protein LTR56_024136 [Elasticomyces elasticus]KAK3622027.1 hypothetical protein LTR22_024969 [Elasticomyces elasticus]KAK4908034.1 hypothetical protein LTR49_023023 [Elasticomyces elasticus]KAK5731597.1 hypothetical protein LTS12_027243 [Elasticomyces elasticus]